MVPFGDGDASGDTRDVRPPVALLERRPSNVDVPRRRRATREARLSERGVLSMPFGGDFLPKISNPTMLE
jgi:hypothetical protein